MAGRNQNRNGIVMIVGGAVVAAFVGLLVWTAATQRHQVSTVATISATPGVPAAPAVDYRPYLVVLPFVSLSEDKSDAWFAEGMTDDIIKELTRFQGFLVAGRNTSAEFKMRPPDMAKLRRTGVRYALDGSARTADGRLRINATLIDTATGTNVWAEKYDRPLSNIFIVQQELADKIVGTAAAHIKRKEGERALAASPEKLEAYELTTQAYMKNLAGGRENTLEARNLAERAIARDPRYAYAHRMVGVATINIIANRWNEEFGDPAAAARALNATARAVELAPGDGLIRASHAIALTRNRRFGDADAEAAKALELSPNDGIVQNNVAVVMQNAERWQEAETLLRRAIALDPFYSPAIQGNVLAQVLYQKGEYTEAARFARECVDRVTTTVNCTMTLTAALGQLDAAKAREAAQELERRSPGFTIASGLKALRENARSGGPADRLADGLRKARVPE